MEDLSKKLRKIAVSVFVVLSSFGIARAQMADTTFYLVTCGVGTETYAYYGHSALRLTIGNSDTVFNWGVFDFATRNFVYKFAKGRLNYILDSDDFEGFLQEYFFEKRYVISQKINLTPKEKSDLLSMININLLPDNVKYRYDFFYDNCSTRIRDLLEKAIGSNLNYPVADTTNLPSFRDKITEYQKQHAWYQFGVDMLLGSPTEKKAGFRERMFLPIDMQKELSLTNVNRGGVELPLLGSPELILDYPAPVIKSGFFHNPLMVFSLILILVLFFTLSVSNKATLDMMDMLIFSIFSLLAILMIFFNFITDHSATKWNFNIIWLNPFILIALSSIFLGFPQKIWFRIVFILCIVFLITNFFLPQKFNYADYPLLMILLLRSYARSGLMLAPGSRV